MGVLRVILLRPTLSSQNTRRYAHLLNTFPDILAKIITTNFGAFALAPC